MCIRDSLTSFGLALALDLLRHPDLPGLLNSRINNVLSKDPLELIGKKLTDGNKVAGIIGHLLSEFPLGKITASFKGSGLDALARDIAGQIPLETIVPFIRTNRCLLYTSRCV